MNFKYPLVITLLSVLSITSCTTGSNGTSASTGDMFTEKYNHLVQFEEEGDYSAEKTNEAVEAFFKAHPAVISLKFEIPGGSRTEERTAKSMNDSFLASETGTFSETKTMQNLSDFEDRYQEIYEITVSFPDGGSGASIKVPLSERGGEVSQAFLDGELTPVPGTPIMQARIVENPLEEIVVLSEIMTDRISFIYDPQISKYAYYYYLPTSALEQKEVRTVLFGMGSPQSTYEELVENYGNRMNWYRDLADEHGYAVLLVLIPEKAQYLYRDSMITGEIANTFWERPDLEIRKNILSFTTGMEAAGFNPHSKVFMTGFSNGGIQSNIFTILHPDMVEATAVGAAGIYMYPERKRGEQALSYPVGINDLDKIPGNNYSMKELREVEHFIFVGEQDLHNDPILELRDMAGYYKENMGATCVERVPLFSDFLNEQGVPSDYKVYQGFGHEWDDSMMDDIFAFFNSVSIK